MSNGRQRERARERDATPLPPSSASNRPRSGSTDRLNASWKSRHRFSGHLSDRRQPGHCPRTPSSMSTCASWAPAQPGVALAGELLGLGIRVCVLENGGHHGRTWRSQFLLGGESVGCPYPRLVVASVSAFGGSSHHWGPYWHSRPLDAVDFEAREAIPHSGWPFGRDHLTPYYKRAEQASPSGRSITKRRRARPTPPRDSVFALVSLTGELQHGDVVYPEGTIGSPRPTTYRSS